MSVRMLKEQRHQQLRDIALKLAERYGYTHADKDKIAKEAKVSRGLVTIYLGEMAELKKQILQDGCARGSVPVIIEGILHREKCAKNVAQKFKTEIINYLFK